MASAACEAWFYHLERASVDEVLPELLGKTLARGWRAMVVSGDPSRLVQYDERLWAWGAESFLAHGLETEPYVDRQPILLSSSGRNLNAADALFLVDGAEAATLDGFTRCLDLFDGRDDLAVGAARERWRRSKAMGAITSYWRQTENGRWTLRT